MTIDSYFQDHWLDVSDERHQVYERVLAWNRGWDRLYRSAEVGPGHVVLDLGAGPGFMAVEMAGRVGDGGHVHATDINQEFLDRTRTRAEGAGVGDRVTTHLLADHILPLQDGSVDRVLAKNVLEYVPSVADSLGECFRVTVPGGRMTATDSDWDFLILQPWSADEQRRFFAAGAHAFREPNIGRKLYGAMLDAGYVDVEVQVVPSVDTSGAMLGVVRNFAGYIAEFETMPTAEVDALVDRLATAVDNGRYLGITAQFSVTGHKPA